MQRCSGNKGVARHMLAFDIETEGLEPGDAITVASVYDPER